MKITIVGAGLVGTSAAKFILTKGLGDVVLIDVADGLAEGKAMDLEHAFALEDHTHTIKGGTDFALMKSSEIVVITAGISRKPGMQREELLQTNRKIMESVCEHIKKYAPHAVVIVVSNPLDILTAVAQKALGFPYERVIGMAGALDSARFRVCIAQQLDVSPKEVDALVIGSHDDNMVPLLSSITLNGTAKKVAADVIQKTKSAGAEIVKCLKTGSASLGPGRAIASMVEAIVKDQKKVISCCVYSHGKYGLPSIYIGLPAIIGRKGVIEVKEISLSDEERAQLRYSAKQLAALQ